MRQSQRAAGAWRATEGSSLRPKTRSTTAAAVPAAAVRAAYTRFQRLVVRIGVRRRSVTRTPRRGMTRGGAAARHRPRGSDEDRYEGSDGPLRPARPKCQEQGVRIRRLIADDLKREVTGNTPKALQRVRSLHE